MTTSKGNDREPVADLQVRINIVAELRFAFSTAVRICDQVDARLRASRSVDEQERIGDELERFVRTLCLGTLALGAPGLADLSTVGSDVKKETP
jgi:hypothetical protein